jgi:hypothetical protein
MIVESRPLWSLGGPVVVDYFGVGVRGQTCYVMSAVLAVNRGPEVGLRERMGSPERADEARAVHVAWPEPVDTVETR